MASEILFKDEESLKPLAAILYEAEEGLRNPERTISGSIMPEILKLGATSGMASAALTGVSFLFGTIALGPAILGVLGIHALFSHNKTKKLRQQKEALLKDIIAK